ncbi:hypothetical protein [Propionicimonas sp.]|uniref:hypothetical protein n=1 Tax=Propionicimonas sp. TaxID=1955623 RepID=UPI00180C6D9E|nr:hypothetical protein [Propionicimonas sp.]MBU3975788.1 hypothetical protein [Actinomycetota bacterium]MBA3022223.1 hypothetical protein [Propionicimonas sp.]MBU3987678.1 hypothetical protein [Actinomycetota bacterium]MBU4006443.1 hypothetical protein [Actinomycetota bacterium]MBU4065322.1 hypothetical protein [Actinomycetota bacterium]
MKLSHSLAAGAALLVTAGCAITPPSLPSVSASAPPTASATTSASPTVATSPPVVAPTVPGAAGALDVSAYEVSMFASPTGAIWCAVKEDSAWCHFPSGYQAKVPTSEEVCPEEQLDVTGVAVGNKVEYFCSGDPTAFPALNNAGYGLEWFASSGFPKVKYSDFTLATLPYGKKLADGSFVCLSEKSGITCGDTSTGIGFKMAKAGVTFIS